MKFLVSLFAALALLCLTGCVHLPSLYDSVPGPSSPGSAATTAVHNATSAPTASKAIQSTFNWFATICILGGIACVGLGALSIYRGCLVSGIKFLIGGVLLPVAGIYVAYHWLLITAIVLVGAALYLIVVDWARVKPVALKLESFLTSHLSKKVPIVVAAVTKVAEVPAPAPAK